MFVGSDGSLKPPGIAPGDDNRFSIRMAGTAGKWNPSRNPPQVIHSGDQINLYCHSVGVGPYGSLSASPDEASPVIRTTTSTGSTKLIVPVHPGSFENPDRNLIQQYDKGTLPLGEKLAFERMGLITARELAPGPTELVQTTMQVGANLSINLPSITVDTGFSASFSRNSEYTIVNGKKVRIDYKKLQTKKFAEVNLD
jgi:hypothetical protein